jgi:hypothetical protein
MNNPFSVKTPETLDADEIAHLFVDVFTDFPKLLEPGHTFLHGPRGSGKSMMLRYLEPDVKFAENTKELKKLNFYAVHVPIKLANFNLPEFGRLDDNALYLIAEHLMVMQICHKLLVSLDKNHRLYGIDNNPEILKVCFDRFDRLFKACGLASIMSLQNSNTFFKSLSEIFEGEVIAVGGYLRKLSLSSSIAYTGALCSHLDFLVPLIATIKKLSYMPKKPFFLLLDDADNLDIRMQKVLNSWVSSRTTQDVSLKISTQMRYKTYRTTNNLFIESPHDYNEINISTFYTSSYNSKTHYYDRVKQIVKRRLERANIDAKVEDFFPKNEEQEKKIKAIAQEYIHANKKGGGKSKRPRDDATRYAIPEYMRRIRNNSNTYSYAGFESLVDISSGIIRFFLDPASQMYANVMAQNNHNPRSIPFDVQNAVLYSWSEEFITTDLPKLSDSIKAENPQNDVAKRLANLVDALGKTFRQKLLDAKSSEQRVLAIMVPQQLPENLNEVFRLGVELGYFHQSTIADKEGRGRKPLYLLSRRLAPYFKLDPTGWAAHLSVSVRDLEIACIEPNTFVERRIKAVAPVNTPLFGESDSDEN